MKRLLLLVQIGQVKLVPDVGHLEMHAASQGSSAWHPTATVPCRGRLFGATQSTYGLERRTCRGDEAWGRVTRQRVKELWASSND